MIKPLAVLFDLDETLLDASAFRQSIVGTCEALAARELRLTTAGLLEANTAVWKVYWPEIERRWVLGTLDGVTVRTEAWRRTLAACGCTDEPLVGVAAQEHARRERGSHRLFDDVVETVTWLRGAHIRLGLVTNGASDTQRQKLDALGIASWFEAVVVSGEVRAAKPDPVIFEVALRQLSLSGKRIWHVGDNLATDVAGAKAAGLIAVWLNRRGACRSTRAPEPDVEVRSLVDLLRLLTPT